MEIGNEGIERNKIVEEHLRDDREMVEAAKRMLEDEKASTRWLEKAESLKPTC